MTITNTGDFTAWLYHAQPGDTETYHTGRLANDRAEDHDLDTLALAVHAAADRGEVAPLCRRWLDRFQYEVTAGRFTPSRELRRSLPASGRTLRMAAE
jgi:hypothetical protein